MAREIKHFLDEDDIGSGEKTPAQIEDQEQTAQLRADRENNPAQGHPLDGGQLLQVVEEQQFLSQHEGHPAHAGRNIDEAPPNAEDDTSGQAAPALPPRTKGATNPAKPQQP